MISNANSVLVTLSVSFWSGYKYDRAASAETIKHHNMENGAGNFNKKLLPKFALKNIKSIVTQYKYFFTENTLPYNALLGTRILPTAGFIEFQKATSQQITALQKAVEEFVKEYDTYKGMAQKMLGDLYNPNDYPTADQIRSKFAIRVMYFPVPEPGRFNSSITNVQVKKLAEQLSEMSVMAKMDLVYRTEKICNSLMDTLQREEKRVHKSTVAGNIQKLSQQLEVLNYENDELLAELKQMVDERLLNIRVADIKDSPTYRKKMIGKTQEILDFISEITEEEDEE